MTAFPIVTRELRVAARQSRTYWSRLSTAAVLFAIILIFLGTASVLMPPQRMGQQILIFFTFIAFLYALSGGAQLTADCISEEKREGTLGLLFLTDLRGYDVVFGKLVATSVRAGYGILSALPVMSILLLLGGVSLFEVFRILLVLLNTLFFSLSAGLLCSCIWNRTRDAVGWSGLIVMGITLLWPVIGWIVALYCSSKGIQISKELFAGIFLIWSPGAACFAAFDAFNGFVGRLFWIGLALQHAVSWAFLLAGCVIIPHRWQDRPTASARPTFKETVRQWLQGAAAVRARYRRRLLDVNSIWWLANRDRLKPSYVWLFLGITAALWIAGLIKWRDDWIEVAPFMTAIILHSVLKFWIGAESVRQFSEDHRSGALELVLCTPLTIPEILRGQLLALRHQFFLPAIVILVVDFLMAGLLIIDHPNDGWEIVGTFFIGMTVFMFDLIALSWLGMWMSLKAKDAKRAAGDTIVRVLVMPWILFWMTIAAVGLFCWKFGINFDPEPWMGFATWFAICIALDVLLIRAARRRLLENFRGMAMRRYLPAEADSLWVFVGRKLGELVRAVKR